MKKILVPVDFSEKSEHALKVAAKIATKIDGELYVLHLLDFPKGSVDMIDGNRVPSGPIAKMLFEQTHEKFDDLLTKKYLEDLTIYENVLIDEPVEGISDFAKKNDIDFIIMGSHGASGFEDFFVGSNTEKVVRTSKTPVLVIKENADSFKIDKVVIASKFIGHNVKEFKKIMNFISIFKPEVHLLRVNTSGGFRSTKELDDIFVNFLKKVPEYKCFKTVIYNDYSVQEGIFNYADSIDAGLVALATRGRQGIMHFLNDSIAESVVNAAQKNILTIKVDKS